MAFNIWKNSRSYITQHILFEPLKKREGGGGGTEKETFTLKGLWCWGKFWKGLGLKHLLHVNKYSLWFSSNTAVILLSPNSSGEAEEQVAAFGGEAGPFHAASRWEQSLPGLPWATSTEPWDQILDWGRGFQFTWSPCRALSSQPHGTGGLIWPGRETHSLLHPGALRVNDFILFK